MEETKMQIARELDKQIQTVPDADRARIKMVFASVGRIFGFLEDLGYSMKKVDSSSDLQKYRISIVWQNPDLEREVSISYLPYDHEGQETNTLTVSIVRLSSSREDSEAFDASEQFMNLKMYLESKVPDFDASGLSISNYGGSLQDRVEKVLHAYAFYMQGAAGGVIRGEDWEAGHFHSWH